MNSTSFSSHLVVANMMLNSCNESKETIYFEVTTFDLLFTVHVLCFGSKDGLCHFVTQVINKKNL